MYVFDDVFMCVRATLHVGVFPNFEFDHLSFCLKFLQYNNDTLIVSCKLLVLETLRLMLLKGRHK